MFACRVNQDLVRISLSYEGAVAGKRHLEVKSFFSSDTLVNNLAAAELWASNSKPSVASSFAARAAAARKKLFSEDLKAPPQAQSTEKVASPGQSGDSGGSFLGLTGMVRSNRIEQMRKCFIDAQQAIRVECFGQPDPDELDDENVSLPGSPQYLVSGKRSNFAWKIDDWVEEKKRSIKAWPLMGFSEFMSFCRQAVKMCLNSPKPVAVANAAALNELLDVAIFLHRHMSKLGTLGVAEVRFKCRMYLHLQFATVQRVMYTSASAMSVFKDATEVFMTRLPQSAFRPETPRASPSKASSVAQDQRTPPSSSKKPAQSRKAFGRFVRQAEIRLLALPFARALRERSLYSSVGSKR